MRTPAIDEHIAEVDIEQPGGNRGQRLVGGFAPLSRQPGQFATALAHDAMFGYRLPQYRHVILSAEQEGASCEISLYGGHRHRATSLILLDPEIIVRFQPE